MKKHTLTLFFILLASIYVSCRKDIGDDNNKGNRPPLANAGSNQIITLPVNSVMLDGSKSTDPENNIVSYAWTSISGPSTLIIPAGSEAKKQVTNLVQGLPVLFGSFSFR